MIRKITRAGIPILVILFLYVPILVLALYSFTDSTQIGAIRSFTLKNYVTLFTTPELQEMILGTILCWQPFSAHWAPLELSIPIGALPPPWTP